MNREDYLQAMNVIDGKRKNKSRAMWEFQEWEKMRWKYR